MKSIFHIFRRRGVRSSNWPKREWRGSVWSDTAPIRDELFGIERLEQHAESLAAAQTIASRPPRGLHPFARSRARNAPPTPSPTRSILLYKPAAPGRTGQLVAGPLAGQYSDAERTAAAASASASAAAADVGKRRGRAPPRRAGS